MKFFNKNNNHDREFIKLQTKLNYSYWIAADIEHYYQNNKNNINRYEFEQLNIQYQKSLDIFNSVNIAATDISIEHKSALYALRSFVKACIEHCDIKHDGSLLDSESFEINIYEIIQIEKEFHKVFLNHLHPDEMETYVIQSYIFFEKGCELLTKLISEIEFFDKENIAKLSEQILSNFKIARDTLDKALTNPNSFELALDELSIINNGILIESDVKEFSNLNSDYIKHWKELVLAYERYCLNILNEDEEDACHSEILDFEVTNYLGLINILAMEINTFILKKLDLKIPDLQIYSKRIIKSPIDYFENKRIH